MAPKPYRVRFADKVYEIHTPPSPPQRPDSSSSWGTMSPTLPSAPRLAHIPLPSSPALLPLKTAAEKATRLHPFLSISPEGFRSVLHWDLKKGSETALVFASGTKWRALGHADLEEIAVWPPRHTLTITIPDYPWTITVTPCEPSAPKDALRVRDVLHHLHRNLHTRVSVHERAASPPALGDRVDRAFSARIGAIAGAKEQQAQALKGVRRLDYLLGRDVFDGLRLQQAASGKPGSETWVLQLRRSTSA